MDLTKISSSGTPQDTPPALAAIDADILAYKVALEADKDGIDDLEDILESKVLDWIPLGTTDIVMCFSDSRDNNFRRDHWDQYKRHRQQREDPDSLKYVKAAMKERYDSILVPRLEADDILGVLTSTGTAICVTTDKDLKQVPGWHMNPSKPERGIHRIKDLVGSLFFHIQWLSGDSTDNFPGIPNIGWDRAGKILYPTEPSSWTCAVMATYEQRGFDLAYAKAMRVCAKMLTIQDIDIKSLTPKVYEWLP